MVLHFFLSLSSPLPLSRTISILRERNNIIPGFHLLRISHARLTLLVNRRFFAEKFRRRGALYGACDSENNIVDAEDLHTGNASYAYATGSKACSCFLATSLSPLRSPIDRFGSPRIHPRREFFSCRCFSIFRSLNIRFK